MSFFRDLLRHREEQTSRIAATPVDQRHEATGKFLDVQLLEGRVDLGVVGESNYQENLRSLLGATSSPNDRTRVEVVAVLLPESDNQYDSNAISVWVNRVQVGYLSRSDARRYRAGLLALQKHHGKPIALRGIVAGGGMREASLTGRAV